MGDLKAAKFPRTSIKSTGGKKLPKNQVIDSAWISGKGACRINPYDEFNAFNDEDLLPSRSG